MKGCATPSVDPRYRVVRNRTGRFALWPAARTIPAGWTETLPAAERDQGLAYIGQHWTALRAAPPVSPLQRLGFGLLFFGGDEGQTAADKYQCVIDAARFADDAGFTAVWLPERHFTAMGSLYPNPAVLHAALRAKPAESASAPAASSCRCTIRCAWLRNGRSSITSRAGASKSPCARLER